KASAFVARALLPDQVKERASRGAPTIARLYQQAPVCLDSQGLGKDRRTALRSNGPQDLGEQGLLGLLQGLGERVSREGVHTGLLSVCRVLGAARSLERRVGPTVYVKDIIE